MSSNIETVEQDIVTLLQGISYLATAAGGTAKGASDPKTFFTFANSIAPPAAIVVFDGEKATENKAIGASIQESQMYWTIYLVAASFSIESEGRLGTTGAYMMVDDVIAALEGKIVNTSPHVSKLMYVSSERFDVTDVSVVYASRWRTDFYRTGA
jgi:hypothetical protein